MIYGSVCSGIESATVAWHPLGWKPAFFSEIEPFPRAVLKHHYPSVPLHGDFTTIQDGQYEPIRLLVGGTPCQSFSVAGLRGGMDDERGNLALEFCKLADRLKPQWLVWENVPGVLSSNGGRDFGSILGALVELGYGCAYAILDAQYFGVPQRRRRVFVVGYFGDWRRAAAVLFDAFSLSGNPAPSRKTREEVTDGVRDGVAGTIGAHGTEGWPGGSNLDQHGAYIPELSHTLSDTTKGGANDMNRLGALISSPVTKGVRGPSGDECQNLIASNISPTLRSGGNRTGGDRPPGTDVDTVDSLIVCPPLTYQQEQSPTLHGSSSGTNQAPAVHAIRTAQTSSNGHGISEDVAYTMDSSNGQAVHSRTSSVRRLTPRECERLQGFPDDYTSVPFRGKPAKDGPRYKAIGNSFAVPVVHWIGCRIQLVDAILSNTPTQETNLSTE